MRAHAKLKKVALSRVGVKKEYDALKKEFNLIEHKLNSYLVQRERIIKKKKRA